MQYSWLIAIPLVLLLAWLAWRRPNSQRLVWRTVASAVAAVSLVLLIFPPTLQQAISPGTAILLTEGYHADTLKAVLQKLEAESQVYTYKSTATVKEATAISSLTRLPPNLQTLHVLGYGLEEEELEQLQHLQLQPHLSPAPTGVQAVSWPQHVKLGGAVEVAGKYTLGAESVKLYLYAAGKARDSIEVIADSTHSFCLRYYPKQQGRYTYTLLQKQGEQTDTLGQVPVQVEPPQQLGVLLLASSPNFEFKFLKNHLAQLQHRVALHTTISKDLSQSEWLNMPKLELGRITPKLLQNFDVVVTEPEALEGMNTTERATLQKAVTEGGLGILTIAAAPVNTRNTAFFTGFQSKRLSQQDSRNTRASWGEETAGANATPYSLVSTSAVRPLVREQEDNVLAGAKKAGWGKVALSLVPQTFPWQLEGKEEVYSSYWSHVLSEVAREQVQERFWQVERPQVPQPYKPVLLTLTDYTSRGAGVTVPAATVISIADSTSINLPLAQQVHQPEKYSGTFWPTRSGWYKVQTADVSPYFFFVQDTSAWRFESIASKRAATQAFAAQQSINAAGTSIAYKDEQVLLIWFFVLFTLSSAFLWLEEKF
ncbi:hypothetical protein POKO110462_00165 [Pontibacter korlensis]|uniref:Aerotolerance regulator N-terminal domain-containing protein n=1 Tax=Pontibacter korlensis TaxID=400092 RepID=A0A0E3ZCN3_9BACT|nr:hypothetical protein [Pontibacter korlensis]AKD02709.1 hypothetical protein PKOR_05695 [Pontibacter korlensis]